MGFLEGKTKLRRIHRWCKKHVEELRKYMPFPNGVPSVSTMSRMLSKADEEMVSLAITNWVGEIINTRGIHIAIDGKGIRAAARKLRDERTPYILNAIDAASKLVIGQLAIKEKTNEMTAIPQLLERIDIEGSTITIDAIGATGNIMEGIHSNGGEFVLQIKKNCPALYEELMALFEGLEKEKSSDQDAFQEKYGSVYDEVVTDEKNRERYEHRRFQSYRDKDRIRAFQEERPYVASVGRSDQVRILKVEDRSGEDITPGLKDFLENGSRKQPKPTSGDGLNDDIQCAGLISSRVLRARDFMTYKRDHWAVENSLHYVLDETFGEDKCTVRLGKNNLSALRKCAYNITRLLQIMAPEERPYIPDVISDICDDYNVGAKMIFEAVPSFY